VLDVRADGEWRLGHIEHALHIPLSRLAERLDAIPRDRPLVVHCASDYRSAIAASLLRRAGVEDVTVLVGGMAAWRQEPLATVAGE
ncbi:MAG TPA: rhodanese-like domain-containing protein, partial [Miltoncostaeaceae bacterium]|nr:rhodanese-like domain-containing protein [Miltoncostaeaceae bacterium]